MGWFDRLKDWAEDKIDDIEESLDDAGSWIKEQVEDIAGKDSWVTQIVDKAGDALGGSGEGFLDKVTDLAGDQLGDQVKGTWAEDVWDGAKNLVDGGSDGLLDKAGGFLGEQVEGTWAEDIWSTVKPAFVGDDAPATGEGLTAAASTMTAADLTPAADGAPAATGGPVLFTTAMEPVNGEQYMNLAPTSAPVPEAISAVDTGSSFESPAFDAGTSFEATAMDTSAASAPAMDEPTFDEPAFTVEAAPEPAAFEASIAAVDHVEDSVDDMFADLG